MNILNLHVQELHQSGKGSHVEEQKDVVSHPVLHLSLRAAFRKRSWRGIETDKTVLTDRSCFHSRLKGKLCWSTDPEPCRVSPWPPSASSPWQSPPGRPAGAWREPCALPRPALSTSFQKLRAEKKWVGIKQNAPSIPHLLFWIQSLIHTMFSELHLEALPVEDKLWSFGVAVQFC